MCNTVLKLIEKLVKKGLTKDKIRYKMKTSAYSGNNYWRLLNDTEGTVKKN
jgi:hypothetical protein